MSIFSKIGSAIGKAVKTVVKVGAAIVGDVVTIGAHLVTGNIGAIPKDLVNVGKDVIKAVTTASKAVPVGVFNNAGATPKVVNPQPTILAPKPPGMLTIKTVNASGIGVFNNLNGASAGPSGTIISPIAAKIANSNSPGKPGAATATGDDDTLLIAGGIGLLALL